HSYSLSLVHTLAEAPSYSLYALLSSPCSYHDPATSDNHTLSLHDALPISPRPPAATRDPPATPGSSAAGPACRPAPHRRSAGRRDRKSTRLNSSHVKISYAVFCLKKKKKEE